MTQQQALIARLDALESRLKALVGAYSELVVANEQLVQQNQSLRAVVESCRAELAQAAQQPPAERQLALVGEEERESTKQLIDEYIRRIDHCIGQLSHQL
jgi:regulator of replication initiation timing